MQISKDRLKHWLASIPNGREWLAKQCGVSKSTVDGWCSNRTIPGPSSVIISDLMANTPQEGRVVISLSPAEFALVETARHLGKYATLDTFAHHAVMEKAQQLAKHHESSKVVQLPTAEQGTPRAAEDPAPYHTGGGSDDCPPPSPTLKRKHG
jgi:hypothetical protein